MGVTEKRVEGWEERPEPSDFFADFYRVDGDLPGRGFWSRVFADVMENIFGYDFRQNVGTLLQLVVKIERGKTIVICAS